MPTLPALCSHANCRLEAGHSKKHNPHPAQAWSFLQLRDRNKIDKTGLATPRGGAKGAYQNHVNRSNRVIIPFEKYREVAQPLEKTFPDKFVFSLKPTEYFSANGEIKSEFLDNSAIQVGRNAFVLYRSHADFERLPPLPGWTPRKMVNEDGTSAKKRTKKVSDQGEYVKRLPTTSNGSATEPEGAVQGIFAPEYADAETNYLTKCLLAWLIVHTSCSPYLDSEAAHLRSILNNEGLGSTAELSKKGVMTNGLSQCPLCNVVIKYEELHQLIDFEEGLAAQNATTQTEGTTRSTAANLFHVLPLVYNQLRHIPQNVAWGHAICNTVLAQRECFSLPELRELGLKVAVINPDGNLDTFGWISAKREMIRSEDAVWIRIVKTETSGQNAALEAGQEESE